jgi:cyanophycinase
MDETRGRQGDVGGVGGVALVGSGEYTDAMIETDRYLLGTLGGPAAARVALLPTASGLEPESPRYWNDLGLKHFTALGVRDIRPTWILDAKTAHDPEQMRLLEGASFYYLSGGNPAHTINSLRGTPAWDVMARAHARGAVLAGCSAGAMALAGATAHLRTLLAGGRADWLEGLGVAPRLVAFPHFDRIFGVVSAAALRTHLLRVPAGRIAVGIDEDTALVRIEAPDTPDGTARWRVMGRQTVTVFHRDAPAQTLRADEEITL